MTSAQSIAPPAGLAPSDLPSEQLSGHDVIGAPDADMIARLANAFFQLPPNQTPPAPPAPGVPVAIPAQPEIPAPSVATAAAPYAPARAPYGPPDLPPTSIPSVVPTPNLSAPAAPINSQPGSRPLGMPDPPQPGASAGSAQIEPPVGIDYSAIPRLFGDSLDLTRAAPQAPTSGVGRPSTDGQSGDLYFLGERSRMGAPGDAPTPPEAIGAAPHSSGATPAADAARAEPESFALSSPSEADPHRISDIASFAAPPVSPPPSVMGYEQAASPGAAGPAAHDALYFVGHSGGHSGAAEPVPAEAKGAPAYAPELAPAADQTRQPFDPYRIKRDFPILQQQVHGKPLIWLDNAATTQKPQAVIDRLSHFYEYENSNIHRAAHALAARSTDAYEAAREKVRRFLKAPSARDIVFVRGATEGINLVAQAWGRRNVREGDEIVVSWLEHHANIVPWQMLCAEKGARLRVAPVDDRGQLILEEYEKLLNEKTKIVAMTQVSNALGTVTPVREITAMAHRHGACVLIDGAQSVSHMPVDVQSIDCDFFIFSGHKVFGPTGIGVVYGKAQVLEHMPPWQGGGNMIADVTFEKTVYQGAPERFEAGTGNIADAVGLGAALDYVEGVGMEVIARYEHDLLVYATEKMRMVPGLTFIGTAAEKASVLSFVLEGRNTQDVGKALDREGIAVRAGHHCAQPILRRFGLEATVRPSLAFYNTCADVDALVAALLKLQRG
ncbi:family 2A encapsulin nanocompartment cargo protein cysteine desulfurase [Methylocystis heyeri]|uniref:Cysteine desulfurase n=1 Tax=Methylocystis heyeri TaxID=391905 RepID=A0A6B8KD99_9HYPH|nr:family 2A encapsulin nanocompartment cargo protein cysteine desulfurase [Methylocystis heyeri]QGM44403.1 SufS family cysteine desulfurase [Methylocystis heyeri]